MSNPHLLHILSEIAEGRMQPETALELLGSQTVCDTLNGLTLDTQRGLRTGLGEVVLAQGKSDQALVAAVGALARHGAVLASRVDQAQAAGKTFSHWPILAFAAAVFSGRRTGFCAGHAGPLATKRRSAGGHCRGSGYLRSS